MARPKKAVPSYRHHKSTGQAVVTIDGRELYLGKFQSVASKAEYARLVAEFTATGQVRAKVDSRQDGIKVMKLLVRYLRHAESYYVKNGKPTTELAAMKSVMRPIKTLYGRELATDFGPLSLKAIRQQWIDKGNSRGTINDDVFRVIRIFRWAASEELIPVEVHQALATVESLKKGRTTAPEPQPIQPVELPIVEKTMEHLCQVVKDMIRLQLLAGMRPGEVCSVRPCDIDRSEDVWEFRPSSHKTEHHSRERVVFIGPEGQAVLSPYLLRPSDSFCFSPQEAVKQQLEKQHAERVTPLKYGNRPGFSRTGLKGKRATRPPGDQYVSDSYRKAIHRACDIAFQPDEPLEGDALKIWQAENRWSPNRLRHTKGTEVRKRFGLEAAQVILGHSAANITEIYAERDAEKGREVARKMG